MILLMSSQISEPNVPYLRFCQRRRDASVAAFGPMLALTDH